MKKFLSLLFMLLMIYSSLPLSAFALDEESSGGAEPKVSVIIPVYNVEKYLRECLDSVVNQTLKEIEIICIDDCSTDNSLSILEEYAGSDNRVKVVKQEYNQGAYVARNKGLSIAHGEYVGFVDPDDYIKLNTYETAYNIAKNKNSDIVVFGGETFGRKNAFATRVLTTKEAQYENNSFNALFTENGARPYIWNKIYKRKMLLENNIKFEEERNGCDNVFCFYVFPVANKINFISDKLYYYRIGRPGNAGKDIWNNAIKNMDMSIKTNKYIINEWRKKGYTKKVPKKFFEYYVELYFNKVKNKSQILKKKFASEIFAEIFTDEFFDIVSEIDIPDDLNIKISKMKNFMEN